MVKRVLALTLLAALTGCDRPGPDAPPPVQHSSSIPAASEGELDGGLTYHRYLDGVYGDRIVCFAPTHPGNNTGVSCVKE
jgi:predicted small lipoprotein YifL